MSHNNSAVFLLFWLFSYFYVAQYLTHHRLLNTLIFCPTKPVRGKIFFFVFFFCVAQFLFCDLINIYPFPP